MPLAGGLRPGAQGAGLAALSFAGLAALSFASLAALSLAGSSGCAAGVSSLREDAARGDAEAFAALLDQASAPGISRTFLFAFRYVVSWIQRPEPWSRPMKSTAARPAWT